MKNSKLKNIVLSFIGAMVLISSTTVSYAGSMNAASEIEKVNQSFEAGFAAGSAEDITAVYTKDGQLLPPNSSLVSGLKDIQAFWQGAIDNGIAAAELETVELDEQGKTAIEVGQFTLKTADGEIADNGKYIVVWKKEDGKWKYHRDMWSSDRAPD